MGGEFLQKRTVSRAWPSVEIHAIQYNSYNYSAWEIEPLKDFEEKTLRETAKHLVGWATLAPSAHNKQPWIVQLDENERHLLIQPDPGEIGAASDKEGRQTHVGIGCFVANLSLAMGSYDIPVTYKLIESRNQKKDIASVVFDLRDIQKGHLKNPQVLEYLRMRRAYRGPFVEGFDLPEPLLRQMEEISENEGVTLRIIRDQGRKNLLGKAQALADMAVLKIPAFRNELASHLVVNDSTQTKVMPGNTFGLNDQEAREVHDALSSSAQMPGHFAAGFPRSDQEGVINSSAVLVILADEKKPQYFVRSGVALEKLWLYAQANGLGVRIMAGLVGRPFYKPGFKKKMGGKAKKTTGVACCVGAEKDNR